jgi:hypothetical protein
MAPFLARLAPLPILQPAPPRAIEGRCCCRAERLGEKTVAGRATSSGPPSMAWPPPSAHDIRGAWSKLKSTSLGKLSSACTAHRDGRPICAHPRNLRRQASMGRRGTRLRPHGPSECNARLCLVLTDRRKHEAPVLRGAASAAGR